ncbi:MAG: hypothetical protein K2H46_07175 [Muribaculaceae bacterium]|nr:hypothetical protein [Muribaculaceae bacterium]
MPVIIILIILLLIWLIFGARITAWINRRFQRFVANRTEDFIRKATGMPPREKHKKQRKKEVYEDRKFRERNSSRRREYYDPDGPIIPKEYAEDVEFIEIKEFSQTNIDARFEDGSAVHYHESQVSDVEWVDIKPGEESKKSKRWKK